MLVTEREYNKVPQYERALRVVEEQLRLEGFDPAKAQEEVYGIERQWHETWFARELSSAWPPSLPAIKAFYIEMYFLTNAFLLPEPLDAEFFLFAMNTGFDNQTGQALRATKLLQTAFNSSRLYDWQKHLQVDGLFGPVTRRVVLRMTNREVVTEMFIRLARAHYAKQDSKVIDGLLRRTDPARS